MGMETASFSLSAIMVGWLGSTALASYQIMIAVSQVCFMMYYGMGAAVSVRISYFFGQKDLENVRHTARAGFHIILAMIVLTGIPIFLLRHHIGGWFTDDAAVSLMVAQVIIPFLLYQFGDGLQINFANALRGIADVRPMMLFSFIAYFLIRCRPAISSDLSASGVSRESGPPFLSDSPVPELCITCASDIKPNNPVKPCFPLPPKSYSATSCWSDC